MQMYTGGCHCGQIRFEVTADLSSVTACNCSLCQRRGFLWTFVPPDRFALRSGEETLSEYLFNKKIIRHLFCPDCGVESFARGRLPDGKEMVAINARCLDGVEATSLPVVPFDGRSL
jgi:hypothetical protein